MTSKQHECINMDQFIKYLGIQVTVSISRSEHNTDGLFRNQSP